MSVHKAYALEVATVECANLRTIYLDISEIVIDNLPYNSLVVAA